MAAFTDAEIEALPRDKNILELGCGQVKRCSHSTTVDFNPDSIADVIHDLNTIPYPFQDNDFDIIIAEHVLEHLDDLKRVIEELHRILKPGGVLYVEVPHFSSSHHFTDPTHRHAFTSRSFDYFIPGTALSQFKYSRAAFKLRRVHITAFGGGRLRQMILKRVMRNYYGYEAKYAFMFPAEVINYELEVLKP